MPCNAWGFRQTGLMRITEVFTSRLYDLGLLGLRNNATHAPNDWEKCGMQLLRISTRGTMLAAFTCSLQTYLASFGRNSEQ